MDNSWSIIFAMTIIARFIPPPPGHSLGACQICHFIVKQKFENKWNLFVKYGLLQIKKCILKFSDIRSDCSADWATTTAPRAQFVSCETGDCCIVEMGLSNGLQSVMGEMSVTMTCSIRFVTGVKCHEEILFKFFTLNLMFRTVVSPNLIFGHLM